MTTPNETTIAATPEATTVRIRRTYTTQEKAEYLALFEQSRMTQADFCREMNLNDGTFSLWRRSARQEASAEEMQFAEVQVGALKAAEAMAPITLHLACGARLEANATNDAVWQGLGVLLKTLNA